jgi:hypothetical protein
MSTPGLAFLRPADGVATKLLSLRAVEGESAPRLRCAARMSTASKYCWTVASQLIDRWFVFRLPVPLVLAGGAYRAAPERANRPFAWTHPSYGMARPGSLAEPDRCRGRQVELWRAETRFIERLEEAVQARHG